MIVARNFVYIDIPKTGSTYIEKLLMPLGRRVRQDTSNVKHCIVLPDNSDKKFIFASVRHPYDRLVSYYFYERARLKNTKHRKRMSHLVNSFEEFLQYFRDVNNNPSIWTHDKYYHMYLTCYNYMQLIPVTHFVRLEHLFDDMLGWPDLDKVKLNKIKVNANKNPGRDILTRKDKDLINDFCHKDFETFGYEKE